MSPLEIKVSLMRKGVSQVKVAVSAGVSRQEVWNTIERTRTTRKVRIAIAEAINKELLDVFPDEAFREPYGRIVKKSCSA